MEVDEWPFEYLQFIERPAPIFSHVAAVRQGLPPFGCRAFSIRVESGNSRRVWLSILHKQRVAPVPLESFDEVITHSLRDEDENLFMRRIVATLFREDACYSVVNQKLMIKTHAGTEVHEYTDRRDWMSMMQSTLGFKPAVLEEALGFLAERGVWVFSEK